MDSDNPWGASSVDASPNLTSTSTPPDQAQDAPRLSLEVDDEDASWGKEQTEVGEEKEEVEETNHSNGVEGEGIEPEMDTGKVQEESQATDHPSTTEPTPESLSSPNASPLLAPTSSDDLPPLAPPIPIVNDETSTSKGEPPMDDFPDDDDAFSATSNSPPEQRSTTFSLPPPTIAAEPSEAPPMDDFDDFDDDDFGEMGETVEGGNEDDDFGDFGDTAPLDASAFDAPPPPAQTTFNETAAPQPIASSSALPPLRLDLSNRPTRRTVGPQLREFVSSAWGDVSEAVSDEPERQVEGVAQVLVTEESRNLLATLSSLSPLRPLDWRRSKIRREHLITMGVPVNLDDSTDTKPLSSLAISSSPRLSTSQSRPPSAPPGASPLPFSSSRVPSRSSTPFADRERTRRATSPPPLDKTLANQLLSLKEDDLTLMSVGKLRKMTEELEKISVEASEVLTHALLMREKEGQDKETYNGMISDLVSAAAKMKTTSAAGASKGRDPKRQGSIRWGRGGG
ncbi:hypothetical protein JCM5353_000592 [Sporobolomyces roseus]